MLAARLYVKAHGKCRFVVALKYAGEDDFRFLVASDLSWRHIDIARLYSLRWLVEVCIQDWKKCGGWNRLSKQQGVEGSERGLIVSLLWDHLLLQHPEQIALLTNKQPGLPAGWLTERLKVELLTEAIEYVVTADDPEEALKVLGSSLRETLPTRSPSKHMAGRDIGCQEPGPSLKHHAQAVEERFSIQRRSQDIKTALSSVCRRHTERKEGSLFLSVAKLQKRWRRARRSRSSETGFKPPQAACIKSAGRER